MQYVRVYADADGETHFEDLEVPMEEVMLTTGMRSKKGRSRPVQDAITFTTLDPEENLPGEWGPWQSTQLYCQYFLWLEGEIEMEVSDGEVRRLVPGIILLIDFTHTTGRGIRTRRLSSDVRNIRIPVIPRGASVMGMSVQAFLLHDRSILNRNPLRR